MNKCNWTNCTNKYYAKYFCRPHYRKVYEESAKRWNKIQADPKKYLNYKLYQRKWFKDNPRNYKKHSDQIYFGGYREQTILRDLEQCIECKVTRATHIEHWGIDLHVNHIDHTKRNDPDNLETLCIRCHARKSHYKTL